MNEETHWAADKPGWRRPIPHPLLATRLGTLFDCFREYGPPDPGLRFRVRAFNLLWVCALRTPLHHLERWHVAERVEAQAFTAPPVFVIGHWRSGTTHLHQLLSQDPQLGVVTLLEAGFPLDFLTTVAGPLLAALVPPHRPMDAVPVRLESPWEEEMAMACFGSLSFFHTFFFPRHDRRIYREAVHFDGIAPARVEAFWRDYRYFLMKVQCVRPGRRLLLKNPANSARVTALRARFPGAKFIHIHRHPEEVFVSTLFMRRKLQEAWALQECDPARLFETTLANQADLMTACFEQTRGMPGNELIEVRLSELESDPSTTLRSIYRQLELPGLEAASGCFAAYLDAAGTFPKNRLTLHAEERERARLALRHVLERWGYR